MFLADFAQLAYLYHAFQMISPSARRLRPLCDYDRVEGRDEIGNATAFKKHILF
jgi:hypothetical protein